LVFPKSIDLVGAIYMSLAERKFREGRYITVPDEFSGASSPEKYIWNGYRRSFVIV
jgi:hypothetical protein